MKDLSSIVAKFKVQGTIEEIKPLGDLSTTLIK